ncbi:MAG TPA: DUF6262 family protein [Mycobacterium sp.]
MLWSSSSRRCNNIPPGLPGRGKPHFRARPHRDRHHQPPETRLVSDTRQQRIEVLKTAARRKSEEKTRSADAAIARLIKRGEPVTFQAVQREAGVSHAFLYNNTRLRARIEHQRRQHRPAPEPTCTDAATDNNNNVAALTAEIARLKAPTPHRGRGAPRSTRTSSRWKPRATPTAAPSTPVTATEHGNRRPFVTAMYTTF